MKQKHMVSERHELSEILRFQESLLRLATMSQQARREEPPARKPVAAERIAEMARQVAQAS